MAILDENKNVIFTGITDENGVVKFTLPYGKYFYQELEAPEGYLIDTTPYAFEIKENGEVLKATMTNEKEPEIEIDTPQTGEQTNYVIPVSIAGATGVTLVLAVILKKKKDK